MSLRRAVNRMLAVLAMLIALTVAGPALAQAAPVNTAAPTLPNVLGYLPNTGTEGTWSGDSPTYAYQWEVSSNGLSSWANGAGTGGTTLTYTPPRAEVGKYTRLKVVATNGTGSTTAYSAVQVVTRPDFVYSANASAAAGQTAINGYAVTPGTGALLSATQYSSLSGTPRKISVTPRGNAAYVTGAISGTQVIYQFSVDAAGELAPLSPPTVTVASAVSSVVVAPNGRYAYGISGSTNQVFQFAVAASGALTPLATPTVATGSGPTFMAISANGDFLYVVNRNSGASPGSVSQYAVGASGQLSPLVAPTVNLPAGSQDPISVAPTPDGKFVYVSSFQTGRINAFAVAANGTLSWVSGSTVSQTEAYYVVSAADSRRLFFSTWNQQKIGQYSIDGATGLLSNPVTAAAGQRTADLTVSPNGLNIYVGNGVLSASVFAQASSANNTVAMLSPASVATSQPGPQAVVYVQVKTETIDFTPTPTTVTAADTGITYRLAFQQSVTGLDASDFQIAGTALGWQVSSVTGEGAGPYTVSLSGPGGAGTAGGDGTVTLSLLAGSLTGANGIVGPAFNEPAAVVTVDRTPPSASWGTTPTTPTADATLTYPLTFSEAVSGIAAGDFTNQGTATGCTFTPSAATAVAGTPINVVASGCSNGTVAPVLAAGTVTDSVGNTGPIFPSVGGQVTIDRSPPEPTAFAPSSASLVNAGPATFSLTLSQAVTGLTTGDVTITGTSTGWSVGSVTGSGAGPYIITLTAGSPTSGTLGLQLNAGSVNGVLGVAGPVANASASATITIDTSVPGSPPVITSGPSGPINVTTAAFGFTGATGTETYQCRIDTGAWGACTSPASYSGVAEGTHTFEVRLVTAAGTPGPAAARQWTVDTTAPPAPPVTGVPASPTNSNSATLNFTLSEPTSTAQCMTDGVTWVACTSPISLTNLQDGTPTVKVREVDAAGNVSPATTVSWNVDTTPPSAPPVISGAPSGVTSSRDLNATIAGDPGNTLECRLDGGVWAPCTSPFTASGLADGGHLFEARQVDPVGNAGPAASVAWTVDTTPPGPPTLGTLPPTIDDTTPTFTFTGDPGNTFECQIDGGAWVACTSPYTSPALAAGTHTFAVRQKDPAGNVGEPASAVFEVVPPLALPPVQVSGVPDGITNSTSASLTFTGMVAGATLECSVDGAAWGPCTSPLALTGLTDGQHSVTVRQVSGGITSDETTVVWTVDTVGPGKPGLNPLPSSPTNQTGASFGLSTPAGAVSLECRLLPAPGTWGSCTSPVDYSGLSDGSYTFETRGIDALGNAGTVASASWTVDTTPPAGAPVITDGPASGTVSTTAGFNFTYGPGGASAECSLDGAAWVPCTSPQQFPGLGVGTHTMRMRTVDAAGNVGAGIATWTWEITTPPFPAPGPAPNPVVTPTTPVTAATIGSPRVNGDGSVRVPVTCNAPAGTACTVRLQLGTGKGAIVTTITVTAGQRTNATIRLTRAWQRRVALAGRLPSTLRTTTTANGQTATGTKRLVLKAPQGQQAVRITGRGPGSVATVAATCVGTPVMRCRGTVRVLLVRPVARSQAREQARVVVGTAPISMASGLRGRTRVALNAAGSALVRGCQPVLVRAELPISSRTAVSRPFVMGLPAGCGAGGVTG